MWIKSRCQGDGSAVVVTEVTLQGADGRPTVVEDFRVFQGQLEATMGWWRAMGWSPHVMASHFAVSASPQAKPEVMPHSVAAAAMRDNALRLDEDEGAPGEPPRCRAGACD